MPRTRKQKTKPAKLNQADERKPFIEHVHELRRRLMYVALSVGIGSLAAYGVEHHIIDLLLEPAKDQQFIYTSPGGGIDFLFRLCLYAGIALSIPVIVYQILRYVQPLIKRESTRFIVIGSVASAILAIIGMMYGYFWGLPAALDFLLHQFITTQIQPLVTIQSYMSFVMVYLLGSAMLLQVPLLLIFINRIRPIKPQRLLKYERHVIVAAVVIAALMNPTPNIIALAFIAGPIILMYQIGILIIWLTNRERSAQPHTAIMELLEHDMEVRAARLTQAQNAQLLFAPEYMTAPEATSDMLAMAVATPSSAITPTAPYVSRPTPQVMSRTGRRRIVS